MRLCLGLGIVGIVIFCEEFQKRTGGNKSAKVRVTTRLCKEERSTPIKTRPSIRGHKVQLSKKPKRAWVTELGCTQIVHSAKVSARASSPPLQG